MEQVIDNDIKNLQKILSLDGRTDLAELLSKSTSEIEGSSTYGSYWNSVISTFIIYSPVEQTRELNRLSEEDYNLLMKAILEIYPPRQEAPEITNIEFMISQENSEIQVENEELFNNPNEELIYVFISYVTEDKQVAASLKYWIEDYGLMGFLAHEDITPSEEWQDRILYALGKHDIFMPVITEQYPSSYWCNQEAGYAIAQNRLILPIKVDGNPNGFLSKYQAAILREKDYQNLAEQIFSVVKTNEILGSRIKNSLIRAFESSASFDATRRRLKRLEDFQDVPYTEQDATRIAVASIENDQIHKSFKYSIWVGESLLKLINPFMDNLDGEVRSKLLELYQSG